MNALRIRRAAVLLGGAALLAIAASTPARADTVTAWNQQATDTLIVTAGQGPTVSALHLAMVHGAVYDAVNAIDRRHEPYLGAPRAQRWYSKDAAAATAAYRVLVSIVPAQQAALQPRYQESACSHSGRNGEGRRHRRRRGQRGTDDRGEDRRRPLWAVQVPRRIRAGPVAAGAAGVRQRPERVGRPGEAVPDRQPGQFRSDGPNALDSSATPASSPRSSRSAR